MHAQVNSEVKCCPVSTHPQGSPLLMHVVVYGLL